MRGRTKNSEKFDPFSNQWVILPFRTSYQSQAVSMRRGRKIRTDELVLKSRQKRRSHGRPLVGIIQRASFAMCNARGLTFMKWLGRGS
jgi:hypothetical protein